uniref:Uncharacterized protein n=1 Tax=Panagrolaimus davidi TaxID=227884 RepID=A0A914Q1Z0_9BILA
MVFEVVADLPSNIVGLKPYLFCPEIIFTLFLNDIKNNMFQCDAPGFTSNTVTLVCQELKNVKSVTCPDRHLHFPPTFLKQQNNNVVLQANNNDGNSNFLPLINTLLTILIIIPLLVGLIYLKLKPKRVLNGDHESNPPTPPPSVGYNRHNGVSLPYNPLPQNGVDETEENHNSPAPNTLPNETNETQNNGASETLFGFSKNPTKNSVNISVSEENNGFSKSRTSPITLDFNDDVKWKSLPSILKPLKLSNIEKPSTSATLLSNKKELIESASTSSLEILSDMDDDDCVPDGSPTNNGVLYRMLSQKSSAKSRMSKFGGTDLFSKVLHYVIFDKNHVIAFDTQTKTENKKISIFP